MIDYATPADRLGTSNDAKRAQWAIGQALIYGLPTEAISILAYECGFNATDIRLITETFTEEA